MITAATVERLRVKYEAAEICTRARFPGSFEAGPARYPVERHNKAHLRCHRLYTEWQEAKNRLERSIARAAHTEKLNDWTNAIAGDFITDLRPGDPVRIRWTNCNRQHEAAAIVRKVNAKTIVCELTEAVSGYTAGRSWPMPKVGTANNCILAAG